MGSAERGVKLPADGVDKAPGRMDNLPEERLMKGLLEHFSSAMTDFRRISRGIVRAKVERRELFKVCQYLRDNLGFEHLSMISAVEYDDRFEIVYHITSYRDKLLLELITHTPKEDPSVDSISSIWGGANWQERESYDLMGIRFNNHPNLERILLPKDYMYHPLRKGFKG